MGQTKTDSGVFSEEGDWFLNFLLCNWLHYFLAVEPWPTKHITLLNCDAKYKTLETNSKIILYHYSTRMNYIDGSVIAKFFVLMAMFDKKAPFNI